MPGDGDIPRPNRQKEPNMLRRFSLALALILTSTPVWSFETQATAAWVYDVTTGTVLMDKNAQTPIPPASIISRSRSLRPSPSSARTITAVRARTYYSSATRC